MKKLGGIIGALLISVIIIAILYVGMGGKINLNNNEESVKTEGREVSKNSVEYAGWLKTEGSALKNEKGENIQLRGISSHGIAWFSDLITYNNLKYFKDEWNINVFRIAMYTDPSASGYISEPDSNKQKIEEIVEMAKRLDMYVIIDWHILNDNNPQIYQEQANEFFDYMSKKYSDTPNVIYEICNEPNGEDVTWSENVKPYAESVIKTIRNNSPQALVIVGTPDWCKDLDKAADDPLNYDNVLYSCHFYAGSHGQLLMDKIDYCISKDIPVLVSECGITNASGDGEIFKTDFEAWIDFLNNRNISWLYWSLSNKDESSSILVPQYYVPKASTAVANEDNTESKNTINSEDGVSQEIPELNINDYLSESGKILREIFKSYGEDEKVIIK